MKLPYKYNSLHKFISEKTIKTHYLKHHYGYVKKLNELILNTKYEKMKSLEEIIMNAPNNQPIFNNAAQVYNHNFYWNSLTPYKVHITPKLYSQIVKSFGSIENFVKDFEEKAISHFGSGYVWLVQNPNTKKLSVITTDNAITPITFGLYPILTLDLWEHSYYIDYLNERKKYVSNWWDYVNWQFANDNLI